MFTRTLALGCAVLLGISGSTQGQESNRAAPAGAKLELSSASEVAKSEFWLGLDDWQNFSYSSSQKHFDRAVALDPNFALARVFSIVTTASVNGVPIPAADLDRAVADAVRASTAEGVFAMAWRENAFNRSKSFTTLLRAARDLMPNEPRVASEYIWILSGTDLKAAVEAAKAAKTQFPNSGPVSPAVTYVLMQSGDTAGALAEAQRYTQLAPTQPASFVVYGNYLRDVGRYDDAEAQYRRSFTLGPKHGDGAQDGIVALASLLVQRGRASEARQVVTDAIQHSTSAGDSLSYLYILAGTSLYTSDLAGSMRTLETASPIAARASKGIAVYFPTLGLALTSAVFGDRKSVAKYLAPVHLTSPGDSVPLAWNLADIYAYTGQADSTFKYADWLNAQASANPYLTRVAHFMRGRVYLTTGNCDKALEEFRQSDSTLVEIQAGSAECEMKAGHREAAMRYRDLVRNRRDASLYDPGEIRARLRMAKLQ